MIMWRISGLWVRFNDCRKSLPDSRLVPNRGVARKQRIRGVSNDSLRGMGVEVKARNTVLAAGHDSR